MPVSLPDLEARIRAYYEPERIALSKRFPVLVGPAVLVRRTHRALINAATLPVLRREPYLPFVVARHSSPLFRKLGDSDPRLQRNKVRNLERAIEKLDGLVIPPHKIFSLWHAVGAVTKGRGYVPGMLLSNGRVVEGVGGGLCQLSNFLFWILLHADVEVVERHHHSVDVFPDEKRTLPFGSGATIFANYLDLKIRNRSDHPLQLKLWLTDTALKGQVLSDAPSPKKFHIREENHQFIKHGGQYFRYNELYRETYVKGEKHGEEQVAVNFAPVMYAVSDEYLMERGYPQVRL